MLPGKIRDVPELRHFGRGSMESDTSSSWVQKEHDRV